MTARAAKTVAWRVMLPVAREAVFAALDGREGRESFWAESAPERDGAIHFTFPNGEATISRIVRREPPSLYEFDYFGSPTKIELEAAGEEATVLSLEARNVPEEDYLDVYAGWVSVLMAMKCWMATGYDLRNHDSNRSWDQKFVEN